MSIIQQFVIEEIAKEIALGKICYIHRYTTEITKIDKSIEDAEQIMAQEQTQAELERKIESYVKVEKPSTKDQLVMMKDFLDELTDKSIRKQLSNALNRKKPVRNFTQAVESDIGLHIHWGNFKVRAYQEWVSQVIIDAYNY